MVGQRRGNGALKRETGMVKGTEVLTDIEAVLSKQPAVTCCGSAMEVRTGECLEMRLTGPQLRKALQPCPGVPNRFRKNLEVFNQGRCTIRQVF